MTKIYKKLFELRKEIGSISKEATNPFYKSKYFDINQLIGHIQPLLDERELLLIQPIVSGCVHTQLIDIESGERVESSMCLPEMKDPQKVGSAVTYYRRYTLVSLLGIQAEDDDANKALEKPWLNEGDNNWFKMELAITQDPEKVTLEGIKKKYRVSKENESKIVELLELAMS